MYMDNDSEELLLLLELEKKIWFSQMECFFFNLISLMKNLYTITKQYLKFEVTVVSKKKLAAWIEIFDKAVQFQLCYNYLFLKISSLRLKIIQKKNKWYNIAKRI